VAKSDKTDSSNSEGNSSLTSSKSSGIKRDLENNMNRELKPPTAPKLLHLNVTSVEQEPDPLPVGPLTPEETQVLLQKLSINNPFYRFRKQSNSLKELRRNGKAVPPRSAPDPRRIWARSVDSSCYHHISRCRCSSSSTVKPKL